MDPLGQGVEIEPVRPGNHDLTVEDAALGQVGPKGIHEFGKVTSEWLLIAAAQHDIVAVSEDDAAEAIPLGLVEEAITFG